MIPEWEVPFDLTTPEGTLPLNQTDPDTGYRYQLNPAECNALLPVRSTEDDIPQGDGAIPHSRWRSGYGAHLSIEMMIGDGEDCAGGSDLVAMTDELGLHLNAMIRTGLVQGYPNARLIWTPTGGANRMLDRLQLAGAPVYNEVGGSLGGASVEVDFDTPYPYYMSETEVDTTIASTSSETLVNLGNTNFYPVVELHGPSTYVELVNNSIEDLNGDPLKVVYFSALPGADPIGSGVGQEIEFNFFTGTAFLGGSGANRLAGVDFRFTEFFPLIPGENDVEVFGATAVVLWNHAWA